MQCMKFTGKPSSFTRPETKKMLQSVFQCRLNQNFISKVTNWQVLKNEVFNVIFYNGKNVKC